MDEATLYRRNKKVSLAIIDTLRYFN
jgi:hypothetical protein